MRALRPDNGVLFALYDAIEPNQQRRTNHRSDIETGDYLPRVFSGIELLVAIDVIESAISRGRKHLGLQVLKAGTGQADGDKKPSAG